jgi:hypothetical protein
LTRAPGCTPPDLPAPTTHITAHPRAGVADGLGTPNWGYRRRAPSARRAAHAQVLLDLSASGLARIVGDWEATVRALRCLPVAADALAGLGMAGAEMVPVVVADNRGAAGGRPDVLTLVPGRRGSGVSVASAVWLACR